MSDEIFSQTFTPICQHCRCPIMGFEHHCGTCGEAICAECSLDEGECPGQPTWRELFGFDIGEGGA